MKHLSYINKWHSKTHVASILFQVVPNQTWVTLCWHLPPRPRTKWIQSKATRTSTKTKPKLLTKALFRAWMDPTRSANVPCLIKLDLIKVSLKLWGVRNGWKWEFISLLRKCYYFKVKDPLSTNSWEFWEPRTIEACTEAASCGAM